MRVPGRFWWGWYVCAALSCAFAIGCWVAAYALYRVGNATGRFLASSMAGMQFLYCCLVFTPLGLFGIWACGSEAQRARKLYRSRLSAFADVPPAPTQPPSADTPAAFAPLPLKLLVRDSWLWRLYMCQLACGAPMGLTLGYWLPWALVVLPTSATQSLLIIFGPGLAMSAFAMIIVLLRRPRGVIVGEHGVATRGRFRRRRRLNWGEMRLLEHDAAGSRYILYGRSAYLTWPQPKASRYEAPVHLSWEEATARGQAIVAIIQARTGLAPCTLEVR